MEKTSNADLLREMIGFAAQRLMELEVEGQTGIAANCYPSRTTAEAADGGYRDEFSSVSTVTVNRYHQLERKPRSLRGFDEFFKFTRLFTSPPKSPRGYVDDPNPKSTTESARPPRALSHVWGTSSLQAYLPPSRHCERSEAIQNPTAERLWIASLRSQ